MDEATTDWWQGAIIYQIYPRSFLDTTGNGVGDLQGIVEKLDYVAELGVDAVWISPFVKSPMKDFGYDVSDYRAVDPMFGTHEDLSRLVAEAHRRGIRVLMDQVLSHTSNQHPWFLESRADRTNAKADWYVWADPDETGNPPNNWISVFGGPSWQWEPRRAQFYLHNFLREQPDLNFHNPAVQDAVLDVCRYWLDLGIDGFRLDVCAFYFHDCALTDNPPNPNPPTGSQFLFNPYSFQQHVNDIGQPENPGFLERLRQLCDEYGDRVLLGELHEENGISLHKTYTAENRLQLAYGYWLLGADRLDAATIRDLSEKLGHAPDDGWPCWSIDNHDFIRSPTRLGWQGVPEATVVHLAALASLRGATCIYQGSELALPEADVPYERLVDPYGIEFYPAFRGRDGARTPMPWRSEAPYGGFSEVEPWLPIPAEHLELSAARQSEMPGSPLNRLRGFFQWRRRQEPLLRGAMEFVDAPDPVLAWKRELDGEAILCVFNLGDEEVDFSTADPGTPIQGHGFAAVMQEGNLALPAHGAYFGRLS